MAQSSESAPLSDKGGVQDIALSQVRARSCIICACPTFVDAGCTRFIMTPWLTESRRHPSDARTPQAWAQTLNPELGPWAHRKLVLPATSVARKQDATWSARAKSLVYSGGKHSTQQLRTQRWFGLQRETQWDEYTIGEPYLPLGFKV